MEELFSLDLENYDSNSPYHIRPSVRGIIIKDDLIALVYSKKFKYYKFPGGGIHNGEDHITTLTREIQEETGLIVREDSIRPYGHVLRKQQGRNSIFVQDNFYYFCDVVDRITNQNLDQYEDEEGFELQWTTLQHAIDTNNACENLDDFYIVMVERDKHILQLLAKQEAIPSIAFGKLLLKEGNQSNPGPWIQHCEYVAIAAKQTAIQNHLDVNKAYMLGLLHDIGYKNGRCGIRHVLSGYHFMHKLGYPALAKICLTHSFNLHRIQDYIGMIDLNESEMKELQEALVKSVYDDYDLLIQYCDAIAMSEGIVDIEVRMNDVKRRHGSYPEDKWNRNLALQAYFKGKSN